MHHGRVNAVQTVSQRVRPAVNQSEKSSVTECFGSRVFNRAVMEKMLSKEVFQNIIRTIDGKEKIKPEYANAIATAMKEWAISNGATHYCHWFQPLTGAAAEKHDSFVDWKTSDSVIEKFDGKQLIQGEPDASSFPSGGLRSTYEARGYTGWDPTSPAFLWRAGDGVILCIPSVFFSWTGDVLDHKIPFHRSDDKINAAVLRLLKMIGVKAERVYSTLGWEQEYFIVDRALKSLRPDLMLLGRTVYGAMSAKGQELEDHYFGAVKDRVLRFMQDFEKEAFELGIPVKTRHNEVAPAQHEVAAVYQKAAVSSDQNILIMELMRQIAIKHHLGCLLHEKPFAGVNGSGKHNNWSLATDTGINLLDPTDHPENHWHFLILLTAILAGVHRHAGLLRAAVASPANDFRLGANEAPPAIISVYLGEALEHFLDNIEKRGTHQSHGVKHIYDFGTSAIPDLSKCNTDRNRTSPFAFTGNKFEFRAVGSSANCAVPITVLNTIVAESLNELLDEIEAQMKQRKKFDEAALSVVRSSLKKSRQIRFMGNNYSAEWEKEAEKRKLPNIKQSFHSLHAWTAPKTIEAFQGVLTAQELHSRHEIMIENYSKTLNIQTNLMVDMFRTQILPAALKHQKMVADTLVSVREALKGSSKAVSKVQLALLQETTTAIDEAIEKVDQLARVRNEAVALHGHAQGKIYCDKVAPACDAARKAVDHLESLIDDLLWPIPKYYELLFLV